jgi:small subunit ribosomal protein S20
MANLKSAIKRIRTTKRNEARNKGIKAVLKTAIKKAQVAVSAKAKDAENTLKAALKNIDKSVSKGVLHKKTASRKKSSLMRLFNAAKGK